ncbi:MAG TPA: hypothetical protein DCG21_09565, partial [Gammaproteobacteria bacterium]|nr:hypothetical protein [Gammaproteobacteria bacterium]
MSDVAPVKQSLKASSSIDLPIENPGVSFKPQYYEEASAGEHALGWFEIHAENYMIDGGPVRNQLQQLRRDYPISCHGVGLSIGSEQALDRSHLSRLKTLLDWLEPAVFSEHLAWSSHGVNFFNDLLPLPYTRATLEQVVNHIDEVQNTLQRTILLENPSTYLDFSTHEMSEAEFISEIIRRSGCGLLLDINNVYVSATNQGFSANGFLDALPVEAIGQIHLAGHSADQDEVGNCLLIDSHNQPVAQPVWELYD